MNQRIRRSAHRAILGAILCATVLSMACLPAPAFARSIPGSSAPKGPAAPPLTGDLMEFLALVPDTEEYRAWVSWGDPEAWTRATGIGPFANLAELEALDKGERDLWTLNMTRQTQPPQALGPQYLTLDEMVGAYGFDLFAARQVLEAGSPPHVLTIVQAAVEPETVAEALVASGYEDQPILGGVLYARGEDYATDLEAPSRAAMTGSLNRIALLEPVEEGESTLQIARATAIITASAAARFDEVESLADNADFRAVVDAIQTTEPSDGELVGLILTEGLAITATGLVPAERADEIAALVQAYAEEPLSPYSVAAFATFRGEDFTDLGVFLVLASGDDPSYVAQLLNERMDGYVSVVTGETLSERWVTKWIGAYQGERNIAYVTVRLKPEDEHRLSWVELLARRDLLFLMPE